MPLVACVRPNGPYLAFVLFTAAMVVFAVARGGVAGLIIFCLSGAALMVLGYPIVVSTLLRVPAVTVGPEGIDLPLMGPRLRWEEIVAVRPAVKPVGWRQVPVLVIVPTAPAAVYRQVRPWLRRDVRGNLAMFGTPIALADGLLDRSLDDILTAIQRHRPTAEE